MAAVTSLFFSAVAHSSTKINIPSLTPRSPFLNFDSFKVPSIVTINNLRHLNSSFSIRFVVHCMSSRSEAPPVSETKLKFLNAYRHPIPSIYNSVLQELVVQQHFTRYKKTYRYDPVYALGFVTVYDQLMEGYPSDDDKEAIFQAYINALNEDPQQYRVDAKKLADWACTQSSGTLVDFSSREGEIEGTLKDIAERAAGSGSFSYS